MLAAHEEPAEGFDSTSLPRTPVGQTYKGLLHGHAHGRFGRRAFIFHSLPVAAFQPSGRCAAYEAGAAAGIAAAAGAHRRPSQDPSAAALGLSRSINGRVPGS